MNYKSYILERFQKVPETSAGSRRQLDIPTVIPQARGGSGGLVDFLVLARTKGVMCLNID